MHKQVKTPDHDEVIRTCRRYESFTFDYIDTCQNIQTLITKLSINHYSVSNPKHKNLNSFPQLLLLLSDDMILNPGLVHQNTSQCLSERNVFRSRGLHFIHLDIISSLSKIYFRSIAKSTNTVVIGICDSKLDVSVFEERISLDDFKIMHCKRNKHGGAVVCFVRKDLSYNILSVFPGEIGKSIGTPIAVGTIYHP